MRYRAVVFDLWQTLAVFDADEAHRVYARMAERLGVPPERFAELWTSMGVQRSLGPLEDSIRSVCGELGLGDSAAAEIARMREQWARSAIVPRADAEETLATLSGRGHKLGLISVCSEDTSTAWEDTPLAPYFDATVFSCLVGLRKPDPRIYEIACERLDVEASDCLFVGDGANDELPGAERAGMDAVQLRVTGETLTDDGQAWTGRHVDSLSGVLALT